MNEPTTDPFLDELRRHGEQQLVPFDPALRDRVRARMDEYPICAALVQRYTEALMHAFLDGTGPFG